MLAQTSCDLHRFVETRCSMATAAPTAISHTVLKQRGPAFDSPLITAQILCRFSAEENLSGCATSQNSRGSAAGG